VQEYERERMHSLVRDQQNAFIDKNEAANRQ
jgi:hypothetical protein